jgi:hypothetical protein
VVTAAAPAEIWVTWCDQVGISAPTVERLAEEMRQHPDSALIFPTVQQQPPYIHFTRNAGGRIDGVRQRREGDVMPAIGESDAGLFALRRDTWLDRLGAYEAIGSTGGSTRERNFLPFIPWLAATRDVRTFALDDPHEAVGVNTPDDRRVMEAYLRGGA